MQFKLITALTAATGLTQAAAHRGPPHFPPHNGTHPSRDLGLESRNLVSNCQAVDICTKSGAENTLLSGFDIWVELAVAASHNANQSLMDFLASQTFTSNTGKVAIAGGMIGQIDDTTKTECSTSGTEADAISAAVNWVLSSTPDANTATVSVNGPSGSWSITVSAAPQDGSPSPVC